jgi:hypothetical protein
MERKSNLLGANRYRVCPGSYLDTNGGGELWPGDIC